VTQGMSLRATWFRRTALTLRMAAIRASLLPRAGEAETGAGVAPFGVGGGEGRETAFFRCTAARLVLLAGLCDPSFGSSFTSIDSDALRLLIEAVETAEAVDEDKEQNKREFGELRDLALIGIRAFGQPR
jgi:hypothetical protein